MLLGFQGERINVDALMELVGSILVMLIRLDEREIIALASSEAIIAVKHYLGTRDRVGGIEMVVIVLPVSCGGVVVPIHIRSSITNRPDKFLTRLIEVHTDDLN